MRGLAMFVKRTYMILTSAEQPWSLNIHIVGFASLGLECLRLQGGEKCDTRGIPHLKPSVNEKDDNHSYPPS